MDVTTERIQLLLKKFKDDPAKITRAKKLEPPSYPDPKENQRARHRYLRQLIALDETEVEDPEMVEQERQERDLLAGGFTAGDRY